MISLVTACMNREAHLRESLPRWLKLSALGEIVIVDWSTREPIADLLDLDPRIRIIRVDDEPRWALAYAYNLGIAESRGDVILKCDADCTPDPAVVALQPSDGRYFAGDWRKGSVFGKPCVNGQCLFTRRQWEQVNGYSELLRRYGYDDTDFYARLEQAGHVRTEIPPELLSFVEHTNQDRVANHTAPKGEQSVEALLHGNIGFHETFNIIIVKFMPWGRWFPRATFTTREQVGRLLRVARDKSREIPLSPALQNVANEHALRTMAVRLCNMSPHVVARMDVKACLAALAQLVKPAKAA